MFATLFAKFGRQFLIAVVVALASALARRLVDRVLPARQADAPALPPEPKAA